MTAADGICGYCLRGFIALFIFGQKCFCPQTARRKPVPIENRWGFVRQGLVIAGRTECRQLRGIASGSSNDSLTDSGLAEPEVCLWQDEANPQDASVPDRSQSGPYDRGGQKVRKRKSLAVPRTCSRTESGSMRAISTAPDDVATAIRVQCNTKGLVSYGGNRRIFRPQGDSL